MPDHPRHAQVPPMPQHLLIPEHPLSPRIARTQASPPARAPATPKQPPHVRDHPHRPHPPSRRRPARSPAPPGPRTPADPSASRWSRRYRAPPRVTVPREQTHSACPIARPRHLPPPRVTRGVTHRLTHRAGRGAAAAPLAGAAAAGSAGSLLRSGRAAGGGRNAVFPPPAESGGDGGGSPQPRRSLEPDPESQAPSPGGLGDGGTEMPARRGSSPLPCGTFPTPPSPALPPAYGPGSVLRALLRGSLSLHMCRTPPRGGTGDASAGWAGSDGGALPASPARWALRGAMHSWPRGGGSRATPHRVPPPSQRHCCSSCLHLGPGRSARRRRRRIM